jgi:release factor glutamine methyltransferase
MPAFPHGTTVALLLEEYRTALLPGHGPAETRAILRRVFAERAGIAIPELEPHRLLAEDEVAPLREVLDRVASGMPLQYALGRVHFHGLELAVNPDALIPRPETEELVDRIVRSCRTAPRRIVDIGTGTGCIALALKKAFPGAAVTGLDISAPCLDLARSNAANNGLDVEWWECDALGPELATALQRGQGPLLVVSNPPYVPRSESATMQPQVLRHEPHTALFVDDDDPQLFYRSIAMAAGRSMGPGDQLWFEAHYRHAAGSADVARSAGFTRVELLQDISGNPRFIHAAK